MDEKGIEAKGLAPLEPELERIRDLKDKAQLAGELAHLHRIGVGCAVRLQFADRTSRIRPP